LNSVVG